MLNPCKEYCKKEYNSEECDKSCEYGKLLKFIKYLDADKFFEVYKIFEDKLEDLKQKNSKNKDEIE